MPEYRIVTKIDPQTGPGAAKTKQDLKGIETAAKGTTGAVDSVTAAEYRNIKAVEALALALGKALKPNKDLEQAAMRVKQAVDQEAAGLAKVTALLEDARRAHAAGKITTEQYARVQALAAQGSKGVAVSLQQQRAGYTQLGFQIQDITQQMALGVNPMVILAQQAGQTASALQLALGQQGAMGRVVTFLAGPMGSILIALTAVLGTLAFKFLDLGDAVEKELEQLKKDARETEAASRAKEIFAGTLDGVKQALDENEKALKKLHEGTRTAAESTNIAAREQLAHTERIRANTLALLENALAQERVAIAQQGFGASGTAEAIAQQQDIDRANARVRELQQLIQQTKDEAARAQAQLESSRGPLLIEQLERLNDPVERIRNQYNDPETGLLAIAAKQATAEEKINGVLQRRLTLLMQQREAAIKAAQATERSNGVATFRSREQAIGIAGKELQGAGLRVSENVQFGGVGGQHPGMGNVAHGLYAIDVNVGRGITEANVPDLKTRFDELARLYQSRGFKVVWNKQVYRPFGNGPGGPAGGHEDHFHVEAPKTIVGKPTQASTAAQALREAKEAATLLEQQADFVSGIENQAAARAAPEDRASQLQARIAATLAEYQRRFNEAASPEQVARITGALTGADAEETAENFRKAYVYPLEAMQIALGNTALEREISNRVLAEEIRLGKALTPEQKLMIENAVLQSDSLERQRQVLDEVNGPMENYKRQLAAVTRLLRDGYISQEAFNAQVAALNAPGVALISNIPGGFDTSSGESFEQRAAELEAMRLYHQQILSLQQLTDDQLVAMRVTRAQVLEQIEQAHQNRLIDIAKMTRLTQLQLASNLFGSLAEITEAGMGKQNAIYRAMFAVSKAFAIAESIIQIQAAMAKALNMPFPANLALLAQVAALGASIMSNIAAVSANFAAGGMVHGPGGPRDDKVPANLSDGEFVINAAATARNRALLEAINNGAVVDRQRRATNDNTRTRETTRGDMIQFNFGDVVVQAGNASAKDGETIGQDVKRAISALVDEKLAKESRSGGRLTHTRQSLLTSA